MLLQVSYKYRDINSPENSFSLTKQVKLERSQSTPSRYSLETLFNLETAHETQSLEIDDDSTTGHSLVEYKSNGQVVWEVIGERNATGFEVDWKSNMGHANIQALYDRQRALFNVYPDPRDLASKHSLGIYTEGLPDGLRYRLNMEVNYEGSQRKLESSISKRDTETVGEISVDVNRPRGADFTLIIKRLDVDAETVKYSMIFSSEVSEISLGIFF